MLPHTLRDLTELMAASRLGDNAATEEILRRLEPLVVSTSRRWNLKSMDREDIRQECRLAVLKAIGSWDETRAPFKAWCSHLMRNQLYHLTEAASARKRGGGVQTISLSTLVGTDDDGETVLLGDIITDGSDPAETATTNLWWEQTLTEQEHRMATLLGLGFTLTEIASSLSVSYDTARGIRDRLRAKLTAETALSPSPGARSGS